MRRERHFNFPVTLLKGFMSEIRRPGVLSDILYFATYERAVQIAKHRDGLSEEDEEFDYEYFREALGELNWKFNGSRIEERMQEAFEKGGKLYQDSKGIARTGISRSVYWDYHDNKKTEWQLFQLLGFLALKSIARDKPAAKVTNEHWIARMSGLNKAQDGGLDPMVCGFMTEYRMPKLKRLLVKHWGMKHYGQYTRGFWISFNKSMTLEKLALMAEGAKVKNKERKVQNEEKEARLAALQKLGIQPRPNTRS